MAATKIVTKKLTDLHPDPANARRHNDRNIDAIKNSLSRFGQRKPIVVLPDGQIVAGNGTYAAAHDLGWTRIEAVVFDGTPEEARAFAIADNRAAELAEWDNEQLLETLGEFDSSLIESSGWLLSEIEAKMNYAGKPLEGLAQYLDGDTAQDEVPVVVPGDLVATITFTYTPEVRDRVIAAIRSKQAEYETTSAAETLAAMLGVG